MWKVIEVWISFPRERGSNSEASTHRLFQQQKNQHNVKKKGHSKHSNTQELLSNLSVQVHS